MKKIAYLFLFPAFAASVWTGCEKDADEGVVPPVENLKAYAGKYRAKLEFTAPAEALSAKVFYGAGKFRELLFAGGGGEQSLTVEELPEGEQVLRAVILNADGISSDPKGIKVTVYGDNYHGKLNPRRLIEQKTLSQTSVELSFEAAEKDETGVYLVFTNTSGARDSMHISATQTVMVANGINLDEPYYFYSVYKPEADAIDDFRSATVDAKNAAMFKFEKEKWTIASYSSDGGHWGHVPNSIDDDVTTFWHSDVTTVQAQMPHWIIVDMQSEKKFDGFYFVQTQVMNETGLAKGFRFEISSDNSSWTNVLEGEFTTSRARQEFAFAQQVTARYFKITILSGYADAWYSQFAEIDLYNELNVSGMNGTIKVNVLVNAERPFQGENMLWGDRMQQLIGWTHNPAYIVSFATDNGTTMIMFSYPPASIDWVTNGKVYQTVTLDPGNYTLTFLAKTMDGDHGVEAYGVVTTASSLPDITAVSTAPGVLGYAELSTLPITTQQIPFTLSSTTDVTIGWVYNTSTTSHGWATLYMDGIELYKEF